MMALACGSRTWTDQDRIAKAFDDYPRITSLIHGGARGADELAGAVAADRGIQVTIMLADWDTHGRRAGYLRNIAMLDRNPDLVLAFWDGHSKGTWHTVREARKRGIVSVVIIG